MTREEIERIIRRYYEGCNEADHDKIFACLAQDAAHYFPAGAPQGPFVGAAAIASGWVDAVARLDSRWTIDRMLIDEVVQEAVVEWTHFKPTAGVHLRGDEWLRIADGRISEIRAYYACPPVEDRVHEMGGFDYRGRGYPLTPPQVTRRSPPSSS